MCDAESQTEQLHTKLPSGLTSRGQYSGLSRLSRRSSELHVAAYKMVWRVLSGFGKMFSML